MPTANRIFGAGRPFALPNVNNPTPIRFGVPESMTLDFKQTVKTLFGENIFPEDVSGGQMTVTGKVSMGELNGDLFASMFQATLSAGTTAQIDKEMGVVSAATPYKITVANSTTWSVDLGVQTAAGIRLTRVAAGSEVAGQSYSVAAGVYTFAAGDTGLTYYISYLYTESTSGQSMTLKNALQGATASFTAVHVFTGKSNYQNIVTLNSCVASNTTIGTKEGDYGKPTYDYEASVDSNGILGTMALAA
jgi:hypothetical protein